MTPSDERAALAAAVCAALAGCCPGSRAEPSGSLAAGTADRYSDIDVLWVVPDPRFPACLGEAEAALERVRPVESVRSDPDVHRSDRRRLLFVRFAGVSLFWRLDLDVRAASIAGDAGYDLANPAARAAEDEWSRPASALANAIGAVKAAARGRDAEARGLLERGFARIGEPAAGPVADRAVGQSSPGPGAGRGSSAGPAPLAGERTRAADIARLAAAAARRDPSLAPLAARAAALAVRHLDGGSAGG